MNEEHSPDTTEELSDREGAAGWFLFAGAGAIWYWALGSAASIAAPVHIPWWLLAALTVVLLQVEGGVPVGAITA